jgi:AcrR family transcriptional regulator
MERIMQKVKPKRSYRSPMRRAQAQQTRDLIIETAERLFLEHGYGVTTVAAIATDAGVSVDAIYKGFGGKPGLVRAIYDSGLKGLGPIPAYQRSDEMRTREKDPVTIMRKWGELTAEVASTLTPIRLLMRAAAADDAEVAAVLEESNVDRLKRMRRNARFLDQRGYLREGIDVKQATDILWTCSSAELYELFVLQRGWSSRRFARFVSDLMISSLLPR